MLNNIRKVTKHSLIYGFGNVSVKLIGLILIPIYTDPKYFSVDDFGSISLLDVTIQLLIALLGFSVYQAMNRWYWDKDYADSQKSMFFTVLLFQIIFLIVAGLPFIFFTSDLSHLIFGNYNFTYTLKVVYASVILHVLSQSVFTLLKLQSKSFLYSFSNIVRLIVTLAFTIYFVVYKNRGIQGVYEAQVLGILPFFIILLKYIYKNLIFKFEYSLLKELIRFSFPLMLGSISGTVLTIFDRYSLNFLSSLDSVGVYSLGYRIANTVKIVIATSIQLAISPIIFQKMNDSDNKRFYSKLMTYEGLVIAFIITLISVFGYEIIGLFTKDAAYIQSVYVIPVISLSIFFGTIKDMALTGLQISKKTGIIGIAIVIVTLINIGLNILLIPYLGIHGASISTLLAQIIYFIIILKNSQKHYTIPYEINKIIFLAILVIVFTTISFYLNELSLVPRIIIKLVYIPVFPLILFNFGFLEQIEKQRIKEFWNKWKSPQNWKKNIQK